MPGPSDDVPRWQPPESPDDVPRWEPPPPSRDVPRWEPPVAPVEAPRWEARPSPTPRRASAAPVRRAAPPPSSGRLTRRASWWRRHPWAIVWALVLVAPFAVFALRLLDESGYEGLLAPVAWGLAALFVAALVGAVVPTIRRSVARTVLGVAGVLVALVILMAPLIRVTLDHTPCPPRAGVDLGVPAAVGVLASWERGETDDTGWRGGTAAPGWRERVRETKLIDYQLVDSGCWERVAPVDVTRTWHEFRVTIETGAREPLSKVVVVHTAAERGDWKITSVEEPLP
jgi:hypothetical protein